MSVYLELQKKLPEVLGRKLKKSRKPSWAMVIDLRRCIGCYACQVACKMENGVPYEYFRTDVTVIEGTDRGKRGVYPGKRVFLPKLCNHCDEPSCVKACPVKATYKREDGVVVIDYEKCIGCGYCVAACPYNARHVNKYLGKADKCDFCSHRLEQGLPPACVVNCFGGARIFGDLNNPESEVSKALRENNVSVLKPETGNKPRVFYIGMDEVSSVEVYAVINPKVGVISRR